MNDSDNTMLKRHGSDNNMRQSCSNKQQQVRHARSGPRASQACQSCASAKAKCDNGARCKRCIRRNTTCIRSHPIMDDDALSDLPSPGSPPIQTPVRMSSSTAHSQRLSKAPPSEDSFSVPSQRRASAPIHSAPVIENLTSSYSSVSDASVANFLNGVTERSRPLTEWDLTTTYNLFDLGNDMDFVLNGPDSDFLASISALPQGEADMLPSPATSPATNLIDRMNESNSDAVFEAFQKSAGRWKPKQQHYRAVEEPHLSLGGVPAVRMDSLGKCDPHIFTENLLPSTRDQILGLIVRSCEHDNFEKVISAFPPSEVLDRLLKSFFTLHATLKESWIHIPTFQLTAARLELLIACMAAATVLSPNRPVQKFGLAIQEFLVFQLWAVSEKANILIRDLQFLQAFALHLQVGVWSGIRRKMEMSGSFSNIITNSLRGGGHYRHASYSNPTPHPEDEGEILEAKWKQWVQEESFKRLVYHMYIHCSQESLMTSGTSPISYSELSLPLPQARKLWFAKSALEWKMIYLELKGDIQVRSPCLIDLLADPKKSETLPRLYDRRLAQLTLLYAISSMIRRYRQDKTVFSANGFSNTRVNILSDDAQHQQILHILNETRSSYETEDSTHSLELDLIYSLLSMHLFTPFDQMELVAGKEGQKEAQKAYPALQQWIHTHHARQAVWHASQIVRVIRKLSPERLTNFYAVASYHASLCLWVYSVLLQETNDSSSSTSAVSVTLEQGEVLLDDEESIKSQRWISQNRGIPVISRVAKDQDNGSDHCIVPIRATQTLINTLLHSVLSRFAWKNSPLVENITFLMRALGDICQRTDSDG